MKTEILRLLKQNESYISGQQLCDKFGVSRTAVWKAIDQLKKEGYEIEAVRNKGYRLECSPDIMSEAEIRSLMHTEWAGQKIYYYDEIDSTNIKARTLGEEGALHGTLVVSDRQVAGKGRRGRTWESPKGMSIYMTLLLRPEIAPPKASMLTLVMAQSVAEGIEQVTTDTSIAEVNSCTANTAIGIKWPNDIVMNRKKVCGILTEMSTEIDYINYVVIGVGINVNQKVFEGELADKATSLLIESGDMVKRAALIAAIMERFEENYAIFLKTEDLSGIRDAYNHMLVNRGREVRILEPGNEYNAHSAGINKLGELVVTTEDGEEKHIFAGEVSVRGIYGYV